MRYKIILECLDCAGKGTICYQHSLSGNPEMAVTVSKVECSTCSGDGENATYDTCLENMAHARLEYPDARIEEC